MQMDEEQFETLVNKRLEALFDLYPIDDLRPSQVNEEMREGLMKFYADNGQRLYIENALKIALRNMATAPKDQIMYYKSRVDVLEQLLAKGRELYNNHIGKEKNAT